MSEFKYEYVKHQDLVSVRVIDQLKRAYFWFGWSAASAFMAVLAVLYVVLK